MTDSWERDFAAHVDGRGGALRTTAAYLLCGNWHAAEDEHLTTWLPGPVSIDTRQSSAGGDSGGRYPGTRGYDMVAGRVIGSVAKVTVTYGSDTATVPVVNGTSLARFVHGLGAPIPDGDRGLAVRAYDARDVLVGETGGTSLADCYVTPDGTKISGDRTDPDQPCEPAVRWR